jgi:hypothetical protein
MEICWTSALLDTVGDAKTGCQHPPTGALEFTWVGGGRHSDTQILLLPDRCQPKCDTQ